MVERKNKSVSNVLNTGFPKLIYSHKATQRGKYLHSIRVKYYTQILKKGYRDIINYTNFRQRMSEVRQKLLEETRKNETFNEYYSDVNCLLRALNKEIYGAAKIIAKENNWRITPEMIEQEIFGGIISFEESESAEILSADIYARIDDVIYLSSGHLKIRDFKSNLLDDEEDPNNPDSSNYRDWMQVALYALILEEARGRTCQTFELIYFPNKHTIAYEFNDEIRAKVLEFVKENGIDALDFSLDMNIEPAETQDDDDIEISKKMISEETVQSGEPEHPTDPSIIINSSIEPENSDHLGWLDTTKNRPLKLVRNGENKMEGYLFPSRAAEVRDGYYLAVEKTDGIRIICIVEEIKSFKEKVQGETSSHSEEVFKIRLNPIYELLPEGSQYPRPQTIAQGKITKLKEGEFYQIKKIPQNGMNLGQIDDTDEKKYRYYMDPYLLFQSMFIGGVQGTGKTSMLKDLTLLIAQQPNTPAVVIFDAEEEYENIIDIPKTTDSTRKMKKLGIKSIEPNNFEVLQIGDQCGYCLTLRSIDPLHLPIFLHELQPISFNLLQRIIQDIKNNNSGREFTFPELRREIFVYLREPRYRLNQSIRDAISRALQSISLDLFDIPDRTPINVEQMLRQGRVTIINVFNLRDDQQRIVALYLLALFHKYNMKRSNNSTSDYSGVIFILDEVQRILPQNLSNTAYQRRIIQFLEEIHHRGRKRKYGIIYATQSPSDIKKIIVDLCNTKIFFQIQGNIEYLKQYLNKEQIELLKRLPTGIAFITCKGKHEPVKIKFPYLN